MFLIGLFLRIPLALLFLFSFAGSLKAQAVACDGTTTTARNEVISLSATPTVIVLCPGTAGGSLTSVELNFNPADGSPADLAWINLVDANLVQTVSQDPVTRCRTYNLSWTGGGTFNISFIARASCTVPLDNSPYLTTHLNKDGTLQWHYLGEKTLGQLALQ